MTDQYGKLPSLPGLRNAPRGQNPPKQRRPPIVPVGQKLYRVTRANKIPLGGPGQPPPGFVTAQQSASEWFIYWASMKVLDPETDPRQGPFYGGQLWSYQNQKLDQYLDAHSKALSTNIDFMYFLGYPPIAARLQSFRYHLATTSLKQAYDRNQLNRELGAFYEIEIYEQDFIEDTTGQAAIIIVKSILNLTTHENPLTVGDTVVSRNPFSM